MISENCNNGWNFNFDLFGGNNETKNTIKIYNYFRVLNNGNSSNLFLNVTNLSPNDFRPINPATIYIPGEFEIRFCNCTNMPIFNQLYYQVTVVSAVARANESEGISRK